MTDTITRPDEDTLEGLDWHHVPVCEMKICIGFVRWNFTVKRCRNAATWLVALACCGGQTYICEKHREKPLLTEWMCAVCKIPVTPTILRWRRI